jgi:hypothetical protein
MKNIRYANCSKPDGEPLTEASKSMRRILALLIVATLAPVAKAQLPATEQGDSKPAVKPKTELKAIDAKTPSLSSTPVRKIMATARTEDEADRILKERAEKLTGEQKAKVINYAPEKKSNKQIVVAKDSSQPKPAVTGKDIQEKLDKMSPLERELYWDAVRRNTSSLQSVGGGGR